MKNKQNVIQQIRFGISQLSAQNGSLQFEHICRHFAKVRICSNLLPATGPVQAGGDQGRDFETFHTYLKQSPISNSSFIGLVSSDIITFACSIEKNPAKKNGKIEKDITTILGKGTTVDRIYFFSGQDIPVAKRHKVIERMKKEKQVTLEVIDAAAISEHLSDSELFWIANQYLNIPAEIYPRPDNEDWYSKLYDQYKSLEEFDLTFEAFQDIKSALRHIYKDPILKVDLPFWIEKMRDFINEQARTLPRLTHQAIYEIFVASLIGMDNIENQEDDIREYFLKLDDLKSKDDFTDATCLISFVINSSKVHSTTFTEKEIQEWTQKLVTITDDQIKSNEDKNLLCALYELKFSQYLTGIRGKLNSVENINNSLKFAIKELGKLIKLIPEAPFYPIKDLSKNVNESIKIMCKIDITSEELEERASEIDDLLGKRIGSSSAAENLRDRAIMYLENGNEVRAISILHKAKVKWSTEETRLGLVLTLLMLSECYQKLHMTFAAKYFAMAAAHFSFRDDNIEMISYYVKSLERLADIEYENGAWLNYINLLSTLFPTISAVRNDYNPLENEDDAILIYYGAIIKYLSNKYLPSLSNYINSKIKNWDWIGKEIANVAELAEENWNFSKEDYWMGFEDQFQNKPFNDVGRDRIISFNAYGINWEFRFKNNYETNAIAEQTIAVFQIILVELANSDYHLLKDNIVINLSVVDKETNFKKTPSNSSICWNLEISRSKVDYPEKALNKFWSTYHTLIYMVLREISLLKSENFKALFKNAIDVKNLHELTFYGKFYKDYFKEFTAKNDFENFRREDHETPFKNNHFEIKNHNLLEWQSDISPKFNERDTIKHIEARYTNALVPIEVTSKKLFVDNKFRKVVQLLRSEGWLDWQILSATTSIAINYKINELYLEEVHSFNPTFFMKFMKIPESKNYIKLPNSIFSLGAFRLQMDLVLGSVLASYDLQLNSETPNFSAIRAFLNSRFKFDELDLPKKSPFEF